MSYSGPERRKLMNKDGFTPQTAFEGYVKASLDNMEKRLDNLPCGETFKRLSNAENKISNIEGRAIVWGGLAGTAITFIIKWLLKQ